VYGLKRVESRFSSYGRMYIRFYLLVPAESCSYSSPVSSAPAVPFAIPLLLALSLASSGFVPTCPGSVIFSVISLFTAVGSCSFIFAGVIGSLDSYSVNGSRTAEVLVSSESSPVTVSLAPLRVSLTFFVSSPIAIYYYQTNYKIVLVESDIHDNGNDSSSSSSAASASSGNSDGSSSAASSASSSDNDHNDNNNDGGGNSSASSSAVGDAAAAAAASASGASSAAAAAAGNAAAAAAASGDDASSAAAAAVSANGGSSSAAAAAADAAAAAAASSNDEDGDDKGSSSSSAASSSKD
jgi:hypothetical protein